MSRYTSNGTAHAGNRSSRSSTERFGVKTCVRYRVRDSSSSPASAASAAFWSGSSVYPTRVSMSARLATSCSSTQLPSTPSSGVGSSIGRCVGAARFGMIVMYWPASSAKRAITRRIRSIELRGSTPRWSPAR